MNKDMESRELTPNLIGKEMMESLDELARAEKENNQKKKEKALEQGHIIGKDAELLLESDELNRKLHEKKN
jgi:hypothetical protein